MTEGKWTVSWCKDWYGRGSGAWVVTDPSGEDQDADEDWGTAMRWVWEYIAEEVEEVEEVEADALKAKVRARAEEEAVAARKSATMTPVRMHDHCDCPRNYNGPWGI